MIIHRAVWLALFNPATLSSWAKRKTCAFLGGVWSATILSPFQGWVICCFLPGLAPWAAFLRRCAAVRCAAVDFPADVKLPLGLWKTASYLVSRRVDGTPTGQPARRRR